MRNLSTVGLTLLVIAACDSPGAMKDPPVLTVTSPKRSTIQDHAGQLVVTGTVTPNAKGDAIDKVLVNNVQAVVGADGSFQATLSIKEGATLIKTVAKDKAGGEADDTRAIQAGQLMAVGSDVPNAITAAMSADAFTKISAAAGPIIKGMDMKAMLAPMQPMVNVGSGCDYGQVFIDDVKFSNIKLSLLPVQGGLAFSAEIDNLDVPGHAKFKALCVSGSDSVRITADKVVVTATLLVTPNGKQGFTTSLASPNVDLTNLQIDAGGIPGKILDLLHLDSAIQYVVEKGAELAMGPIVNSAFGALAGPQKLNVLGKTIDIQVDPTDLSFDSSSAVVATNVKLLIEGSESSPGFIFTDNGLPSMDAGHGFALGLADDLANEMLAEFHAVGGLNLSLPTAGGTFDTTAIQMTLPPMISADPADGKLRLILGDMVATYMLQGKPVAKAAINASVDLRIDPAANGYAVAINLGKPDISVNVLPDFENDARLTNEDLGKATEVSMGAQLDAISKLLVNIPLPAIAGLQPRNLSIGSDSGYVMVKGQFD